MSKKTSLILTVTVSVIAVAALIFTFVMLGRDNDEEDETGFVPDEALALEMQDAADRLTQNNAEVLRLFYRLHYNPENHFEPEPYNREPESGFYTLREGLIDFDTVDEIFAFVDETFVESAAEQIKTDDLATGIRGPVYQDVDGRIGVNIYFEPIEHDFFWTNVGIDLTYESETEVILSVSPTTQSLEKAYEERGDEFGVTPAEVRMVKGDDGWRLEGLIHVYTQF
ncbi:MAG: hypothetical protein FWG45_00360 [Oscillospiraceae bacterium]|nr:hypothetical protein [Oscillospiraceae bacterium]